MIASAPLITTRFAPPRISPQTVSREQLLDKLQRGRHSRLLLVTGGAGFGKTTLIAQWRQQLIKEGARIAWLSLTPDDGTLESFCASLLGALRQAGLPLDEDLLLLAGAESTGLQTISGLLVNALARTSGSLYLMLDDFHHAVDPRIATLMQSLVDNLPQEVHLLLASRTTPSLLLGRLRGLGELCEVDCKELPFDFRETVAFVKTHLDQGVELDAVHVIHELTRGWPIGLQLMSIALKANSKKPMHGAVLMHNSSGLVEYLSEDVMANLPAELFDFLLKISILRRFNAEVAAYLTDSPQAAAMIAAIEERNLFIQPVDLAGQHQWYRLHPLFVEFLGKRLQESGVDVPRLHRRAAQWFEQAGLVQDALRHGLLCEDFDVIVGLLERVQPDTRRVSHLSQFMRWLEPIPLNVLAAHPSLLLQGIWGAVLTVLTSKAETWLGVVERESLGVGRASQLVLLKASLAMHRDDDTTCMALLESIEHEPLETPFLEQVRIGLTLSGLATAGRHGEARSLYRQPAARCLRSDDEMALIGVIAMASANFLEGKVLEAERLCAPILERAEALHGRRSVSACTAAVVMAEACYELDRIEDVHQALANRLDILRFSAPVFMIGAALCQARLKSLRESPRAALEYLAEKEDHFRSLGLDRGVGSMLAEQLRLVLACGDWSHAETLLAKLDDLARSHRGATPCDAEIMTLAALAKARLSLARYQPEAAMQALDIAHRYASEFDRGRWRVQVDLLRAFALEALERRTEARERLHAALACGYRLGLVRTFLDEGERFQSMLGQLELDEDSVLGGYCRSLDRKGPVARPEPCAARPSSAQANQMMTRRELEILDLLEQSMSNKRIALALNLSLQTVKWNLKNIFAKLGVSSRYDAIIAMRRRREEGS
ncbi:plasmid partition protein [Pseudomonas taiwanensis]|uniref:LuxR C-terminal-related transcriptional regulator n=1 Tax=Pseudomonas taiwanensis TaxID=470150 RepID=UPI0015B81BA6|nr:LuxR C-terminal-related transcriptional regulator [Pseudomonas taiwanensis]NWL81136.1 plasmid partition protein [Pseudomonas taiwanensis]